MKTPTKLETEWKNLELCEMQEEDNQIESRGHQQDEGYDLSENSDTVYE